MAEEVARSIKSEVPAHKCMSDGHEDLIYCDTHTIHHKSRAHSQNSVTHTRAYLVSRSCNLRLNAIFQLPEIPQSFIFCPGIDTTSLALRETTTSLALGPPLLTSHHHDKYDDTRPHDRVPLHSDTSAEAPVLNERWRATCLLTLRCAETRNERFGDPEWRTEGEV